MDEECFEDMLFGFRSSQDTFDDIESTSEPEDDMLEEGLYEGFDAYEICEDADLLSPESPIDHDAEMLAFAEEADMESHGLYDLSKNSDAAKERAFVIARVESMLEKILDGLLADDNELTIALKSRASSSRRANGTNKRADGAPQPKIRKISFPGATAQEAWRFTVLLRIIEIVHGCLVDEVVVTKRDIYYRHPDLFVKQSTVDRYIDGLACTLGVPRAMLNVTAAAKGLVAGNFTLWRSGQTVLDGAKDREGSLIPKVQDSDSLDLSPVRWVVVIEKEATFRAVLSSAPWQRLSSEGIIVTAKGYPDLDSRRFLRHIADRSPDIPMYALVDFDPDGIAIMSTYKHGSYRLAHEKLTDSGTPGLGLPRLGWLGVQSQHVCRPPVNKSDAEGGGTFDAQGLMRLTPRDRKKAVRMLEWDLCAEDGPEARWRCELQTMLMLNVKAEMQILEERSGGVASWLEEELSQRQDDEQLSRDGY